MFKTLRKYGDYDPNIIPENWSIEKYLAKIQKLFIKYFQCKLWYGGSLAVYLQNGRESFGDLDIITDRVWPPYEIPWPIDRVTQFSYQVWKYDVDFMYAHGACKQVMEWAAYNCIQLPNGIFVQNLRSVNLINWHWRSSSKARLYFEPTDEEKALIEQVFNNCNQIGY